MPGFQSYHTLRLLLLRVNYIQLQIKSNNFHKLTIKTKRILGLKLGQIQIHIIMTCAWRSAFQIKILKNIICCSSSSMKRMKCLDHKIVKKKFRLIVCSIPCFVKTHSPLYFRLDSLMIKFGYKNMVIERLNWSWIWFGIFCFIVHFQI